MIKQIPFIYPLVLFFALSACQTQEPAPPQAATSSGSAMAPSPTEPPANPQPANDPKSLALSTLNHDGTFEEVPSKARERFGRLTRERRTAHEGALRQKRDGFAKEQKTKRDIFLDGLKDDRARFTQKKTTPVERREFQTEQDKKRRSYFADESSHRRSFEAGLSEERRQFEEASREMTRHFNDALRDYTSKYNEHRKSKPGPPKAEAPSASTAPDKYRALLDEFKQPVKGPVIPLKTSGH